MVMWAGGIVILLSCYVEDVMLRLVVMIKTMMWAVPCCGRCFCILGSVLPCDLTGYVLPL